MRKIFIFICLLFSVSYAGAADHYAASDGTDSWGDSTNIGTPCSIFTAFDNASAGDTVYFRGGTYNVPDPGNQIGLETNGNGSSGNRIVFIKYAAETPVIQGTASLKWLIGIENQYWTLDGLTLQCSLASGGGHDVVKVGADSNASYLIIQNCTITVLGTVGHDNLAPIGMQGARHSYALIQNNNLTGLNDGGNWSQAGVHIMGTPGSVGVKILNNNMNIGQSGVRIKHANADTSLSSGCEVAYNYVTNTLEDGLKSNPRYCHIHDNIFSRNLEFGDNGGGAAPAGNLVEHNTFTITGIDLWNGFGDSLAGNTFRSNIFPTKFTAGNTEANNTWDYNMYGDDAAIGANDLGTTDPIYVGGESPNSIAGFALTAQSPGFEAGHDSEDMGADVSLVGTGAEDTTAPEYSSGTINETVVIINWSEACTRGAGYNNSDIDLDMSETGANIGVTYVSGDGTSQWSMTAASAAVYDETVDLDFNGDANSIEDDAGNDLEALTSESVTNNTEAEAATANITGTPTGGTFQ